MRKSRAGAAPLTYFLTYFLGSPGQDYLPEDDERRDKSASHPAWGRACAGPAPHRIVIVGGGAGGLELAARLGDGVGRRGEAEVILVDPMPTHLWKPLLHEVAAGTLNPREQALDYLQQARQHHFRFHPGRLEGLVRHRREIWLAPLIDGEGVEMAARRRLPYDTLVIAIGATDDDFGTPGVRRHAISLNSAADAEHFRSRLLSLCAGAGQRIRRPIQLVIVGGGATGVELADELTGAVEEIASCGYLLRQAGEPVKIRVLEARGRLLAALPAQAAERVHCELVRRGVDVRLNRRVAEVRHDSVLLCSGEVVAADLVVWTAGIQGPEVLASLGALDTNERRQLLVRTTLQTFRDDNIFAIGDCASCVSSEGETLAPPLARAAQQQAKLLARSLQRRLAGKSLLPFRYRESGARSPARDEEPGGDAGGDRSRVDGVFARFSYWMLYRRHLAILLGGMRTLLMTIGERLPRRSRPRMKLH
ncbi:NAD(P)/FAD-dependent oxidoreductase [Aromatoleum anaerobium]|uniref:NAD(P)/FAD-dependent oxidoreductase n=1 Tax=Aromatoleum anaerobium TaxID=182180 RepID=A0ABX1PLA4_9RHOO|nr:FAD-dependent oxidoreductase [Aromatoleum anaerobium]MCK0508361.1 FAD-dependent oxidoreductase [Aromatoleum anaerobium]